MPYESFKGESIIKHNFEKLIEEIWLEKRDKAMGEELPSESLYLSIPTPNITVAEVAQGVLDAMLSIPAEKTFEWSRHWGRSKVIFGFDGLRCGFLDNEKSEAKKTIKIHTDMLVNPASRIDDYIQDRKYFIILNNEPSPIEGLVLQTARMVDELVWCLGLEYRKMITNPVDAHQSALKEVREEGISFTSLERNELLELRENDARYHFAFSRINSLLFRMLQSVEEIMEHVITLDPETSTLLSTRYKEAYTKLFKEEI